MSGEGISGDWPDLRRLIGQLERTGERVMSKATDAMMGEVVRQYHGDFVGARSPWGVPWAPTKLGGDTLLKTNALANPQVSQTRGVVRLKPERYWIFHQAGTERMPERPVLAYGKTDWDPPIIHAIERAAERQFPT